MKQKLRELLRSPSGLVEATEVPWWLQGGTIVEVPWYAIRDTTGNGIGDLKGAEEKVPVWAAQGHKVQWYGPWFPSGGQDRGYDVTEYRDVDELAGTLDDAVSLVNTSHQYDQRVILDIVPCHTSRRHRFFESSRWNPTGPYGDWYVWRREGDVYLSYTDEEGRKREVVNVLEVDPAPRMVRDREGHLVGARNWTFDDVRGEYYYRPFKAGQPALNWRNPAVQDWMLDNFRFWAEIGVDGFRVDAVPYPLQEEGTKNWDLPAVHEVWRRLNQMLRAEYPDVLLLCEADVEDDTSYAGRDEFQAVFDFRGRAALWLSWAKKDASRLLDTVTDRPAMPEGTVRVKGLSTHDDVRAMNEPREEQELLQSYYGNGERGVPFVDDAVVGGFAALLDFDRAAMEMMLMRETALPGKPMRYPRDLLGVGHHRGLVAASAPDSDPRDGVRTPMHWCSPLQARNAGFSDADPAALYLPFPDDPESTPERLNYEDALRNERSWLHFERAVNLMVRDNPVLVAGSFDPLKADSYRETWGCLRVLEGEAVMFVFNEALSARAVHGGLPDDHRRRLASAELTDLFGGAPLGQLRGDHVEFPLATRGWMALKLLPTRRRAVFDLVRSPTAR